MAPKKAAAAPKKETKKETPKKEEKVVKKQKVDEVPAEEKKTTPKKAPAKEAKPKAEPKPKQEKPEKKGKAAKAKEEPKEEAIEEVPVEQIEDDEDMEEIIRLVDLEKYEKEMNEIEAVLEDIDAVEEEDKVAAIEYEYIQKKQPLYAKRAAAIKKIPDFWAQAFVNSSFFTWCSASEKALTMLKLLEGLEITYPTDDSCVMKFTFKPNEFFKNKEMTRSYKIESDEDGMEEMKCTATKFDWTKKIDFEEMKRELADCQCKEPEPIKETKATKGKAAKKRAAPACGCGEECQCEEGCECVDCECCQCEVNCICKGECDCHELIHPLEWLNESEVQDYNCDIIAAVIMERLYPNAYEYFLGDVDEDDIYSDDMSGFDEDDMEDEEEE